MRRYRNYKRKRKEKKGYGIRRTVYANDDEKNTLIHYPSNYVQTTRYNVITFLPKNLWEQFHRVANVFFVFLMVLTLTPISPVIPGPTIAAVVAILTFQAVKDAYEDYKRYKSDIEVNSRTLTLVHPSLKEETEITWDNLKVGNIIKVFNNTEIPADLLLLSSSRADGQCFVETANLDGETNLKLRSAHPQTASYQSIDQLSDLRLEVDADEPCARLYEFDGSIIVNGEEELPLTIDNFLHRGTMLRNTEYVYGLVLYTGHQTKFMLNISEPRHKISKLERSLNGCIIGLIVFLILLCLVSAIIGTVVYEYDVARDDWYIQFADESGEGFDTFKSFLTFVVVYGNLIPLSLYVNLEITRLFQSMMLQWDAHMYCKEKQTFAIPKATNLMEELGQIDYIFSDKTGTLTRNEMVFRVCSVGGHTFGEIPKIAGEHKFNEEEYVASLQREDVEMDEMKKDEEVFDERLVNILRGDSVSSVPDRCKSPDLYAKDEIIIEEGNDDVRSDAHNLFLSLAICNTVVPSLLNDGLVYQSSSPDETALVLGAKRGGYELKSRSVDECSITIFGQEFTYEVLAVNEFTSDRRRMSVIVRMPDGSIRLYIKGADESIFPRANMASASASNAKQAADDFAVSGLRTLIFAYREISDAEFDEWAENSWNTARLATENRRQRLVEAAELIEKDLNVVGTTGIEDRLQDAVPETIADLTKANIKVWVLTGDKGQTAINIAEACTLIMPEHRIIRIKAEGPDDLEKIPQLVRDGILGAEKEPCSLVMDGKALAHALELHMDEELVQLGCACSSVVFCRSTPIQKEQVVMMMKTHTKVRTLGVGDGANDVAMIQAAHVGVGVKGNEGMQAVMSADFVIGQFRFLRRLLILHGRWNYQRCGFMVCYLMYKNALLTLIPFWFVFFSQWSGEVYLDPWIRTLWNLVFTAAPIVIFSILEQDLPERIVMENPGLYMEGQRSLSFNWLRFTLWIIYSLWDGLVSFFGVVLTAYGLSEAVNVDGLNGDYYATSTTSYTIMCVVANLHLFIHTRYWNCLTHWIYWLTLISWFLFGAFYCTSVAIFLGNAPMYGVMLNLYTTPLFYITVIVWCWAGLCPDMMVVYIRRTFFPKGSNILQEAANFLDWRREYPSTGRWCCEKGDCCCKCCRRIWCECC